MMMAYGARHGTAEMPLIENNTLLVEYHSRAATNMRFLPLM